jgi:hypothetical protein
VVTSCLGRMRAVCFSFRMKLETDGLDTPFTVEMAFNGRDRVAPAFPGEGLTTSATRERWLHAPSMTRPPSCSPALVLLVVPTHRDNLNQS